MDLATVGNETLLCRGGKTDVTVLVIYQKRSTKFKDEKSCECQNSITKALSRHAPFPSVQSPPEAPPQLRVKWRPQPRFDMQFKILCNSYRTSRPYPAG